MDGHPAAVRAPVAGTVEDLAACTDVVFAGGMLGPGVLVRVTPGRHEVVTPQDGSVVAQHPHAVVVRGAAGDVLVHLGLGTVALRGAGFAARTAVGDDVRTGQRVATWDTGAAEAAGHDLVVPVVVLQAEPSSVTLLARPGAAVRPGESLLRVTRR